MTEPQKRVTETGNKIEKETQTLTLGDPGRDLERTAKIQTEGSLRSGQILSGINRDQDRELPGNPHQQ